MLKRRITRWIVAIVGLVALSIAGNYVYTLHRLSSADRGFKSYTGIALPTGVSATAHGSEMDDNLFHTTHYWTLKGPVNSLQELAKSFDLERSDEDAKWALPDMQRMFGLGLTRDAVLEGYEGSLDGGRDRWLIILTNEQGAVFVY